MKFFRKALLTCIILALFTVAINAQSIITSIDVYYNVAKSIIIDGVDRTPTEKKPFIYQGTTYVPLRYISEALNKPVDWDGKTGTIYIGTKPNEVVYLTDINPYNINDFDNGYSKRYKLDETMTMGNHTYNKGLQLRSGSFEYKYVYYNLDGQYTSIKGLVGLDDSNNIFNSSNPVMVNFYLDGKKIESIEFNDGDLPKDAILDVTGGLQLKIEVGCKSNNSPTINLVNMEIQ